MADGHERYERLALGHVVGGLDDVDNATFRAHMIGCRECRSRVAELRAIDSSLHATEREERTTGGTTEVRMRADEAPPRVVEVASWRRWPWRMVLIGTIPTLLLVAMAAVVWVRAENQLLGAVNQTQEQVLRVLAAGEPVALVGSQGTAGIAAATADAVVLDLAGLPELALDEALVVWLLDDAGATVTSSAPLMRGRTVGGAVAVALDRPLGATELVVSIERVPLDLGGPRGNRLLAGPLPAVTTGDAGTPSTGGATTAPAADQPEGADAR